jgi:cell division protein FtsB
MTGNFLVLNPSTMVCKRKQKTDQKSVKIRERCFSRSAFVLILVTIICWAGVMYVFQVNQLATMGYEMKKKESSIDDLLKNNKQLELEAAQLKSIYSLEDHKESLKMKKPQEVSVLEVEFEKPVAMSK